MPEQRNDCERVCRDDGGAVRDSGPLAGRAVRTRGFGAELVVHYCRSARLSLSALALRLRAFLSSLKEQVLERASALSRQEYEDEMQENALRHNPYRLRAYGRGKTRLASCNTLEIERRRGC